jgi:hypothetical protein
MSLTLTMYSDVDVEKVAAHDVAGSGPDRTVSLALGDDLGGLSIVGPWDRLMELARAMNRELAALGDGTSSG